VFFLLKLRDALRVRWDGRERIAATRKHTVDKVVTDGDRERPAVSCKLPGRQMQSKRCVRRDLDDVDDLAVLNDGVFQFQYPPLTIIKPEPPAPPAQ
jgi:hypothetical protein